MTCSICGKAKRDIKAQKSSVCAYRFFACASCRKKQLEPRWLLVLIGRSAGVEAIEAYIKQHRYEGDEITASELLV